MLSFSDYLKKYSIIAILIIIVHRYIIPQLTNHIIERYPPEDFSGLNDYGNLIDTGWVLFFNLIVGIIIVADLDRKKILTWVLFFGCIFASPWISILLLLIWKLSESR